MCTGTRVLREQTVRLIWNGNEWPCQEGGCGGCVVIGTGAEEGTPCEALEQTVRFS